MLYRLKSLLKKDITHLYAVPTSDLQVLALGGNQSARMIDSEEIKRYSTNPAYDISLSTAATVDDKTKFCCGTFLDDVLTAYCFFAVGEVDPTYNSAGEGFGGVGFRLPSNVLYMYKLFVLPEYRGKNQISAAIRIGVSSLLPSGGWVISSTNTGNLAAQGLFRKLAFTRQSKISEYRVLGLGHYKMPLILQLGIDGNHGSATVELQAGQRHL